MRASIILALGNRKDPYGIMKDALNAAYVISFAPKGVFMKGPMVIFPLIWTFAKDVVSVHMNVGPLPLQWLRRVSHV